jgi:hypothetical protein
MDFVSAWKAASIAFTGAFGLMGLLTENKNKKTGKLTTWGKVSLGGIVLSTILGVAAQLKENSDEAQSREASASQTLELMKKTNSAVSDIQRLLSPFDISHLSLVFDGSCKEQKFAHFCTQAKNLKESGKWALGNVISTMADPTVWKMWTEQNAVLPIHLDFFREPPTPETLARDIEDGDSDFSVEVIATNYAKDKSLELNWSNGKIQLAIFNYAPYPFHATDKISSLIDLQGASLVVTELNNLLAVLTPTWINIETKQGRVLNIDTKRLERISVGNQTAYLYRFESATRSVGSDNSLPKR